MRLLAWLRSRRLDRDFNEELRSHLTLLTDDYVRRGMTPDEARRMARLRLGNPASLQEDHRAVRGLPAFDELSRDVQFAFRLMKRDRWFSTAVIVALALGIGVNATGFTIVSAAFAQPFDDIYMVSWRPRSGDRSPVSHVELQDLRAGSRAFAALAAFNGEPMNIADDRRWPDEVRGAQVTANALTVLRQQPVIGRDFSESDERKGAPAAAIIGYGLWKSRYNGRADVLGMTVRVNGRAATVVGVAPEGMKFPENSEIWIPFLPTPAQEARDARVLRVFGRLRDGRSARAAEDELTAVAQRLAADHPATNRDLVSARVQTFSDYFVRGPARMMFIVMMGAVCLVLVVACANVANLLLSRSSRRAREMSVRMALGATRARVVRQLLIESIVLAAIAGSLGLALSLAGVSLFDAAVQDPGKPYWIIFKADYAVFAYVAAICVVTAILSGLAPALHVSSAKQTDSLNEISRDNTAGTRARWFTGMMVVTEVALSVVLLVGAGLMIRSFIKLYTLQPGFPTEGIVTLRMQLPESKYGDEASRRRFFDTLESRLMAVSGVESVAVTTGVPPNDGGERSVETDSPAGNVTSPRFVSMVTISPSYFDVLGITPTNGRVFEARDGGLGLETVLINERAASQFFPGENPIGRRLRFQRQMAEGAPAPVWLQVVGVVPSIRQGSAQNAHLNPVVYVPYRQDSRGTVSLMIRSRLRVSAISDLVRREVQQLDADQPVLAIRTIDDHLQESRWPYRVFGTAFGVFAAIALALSSVGVYAVMAYSVMQRTREIGMRLALGAPPRQLCWVVLRRGLMQLSIGLVLGLAGALALGQLLGNIVVDMTAADPLTFAAITALLTVVAVAACALPARQAMRVNPLAAIRAE